MDILFETFLHVIVIFISLMGFSCTLLLNQCVFVQYCWLIQNNAITPLKYCISVPSSAALILSLYFLFGQPSSSNRTEENANYRSSQNFVYRTGILLAILTSTASLSYIVYQIFHLHVIFDGTFQNGMELYKDNIDVKSSVDMIQIRYKCCGDFSYKDWLRKSWQQAEQRRIDFPLPPSVPFSCCNSSSMRPCVHTNPEEDNEDINYFFITDFTLYRNGCNDILQTDYLNILHYAVIGTSTLVLAQVMIISLSCCENPRK